MRIAPINHNKISFQRRLNAEEENDFRKVVEAADVKLGNGRQQYFIIPSISIPESPELNRGAGNLTSKKSNEFLDFIKTYANVTHIQHLPQGEVKINEYGTAISYGGSALSLGEQVINPELLTQEQYGSLLTKEEFNSIIDANKNENKPYANLENILPSDSPQEKALRKAYERFKTSDNKIVQQMRSKMDSYVKENKDWLEPKGIFLVLEKKNGTSHHPWWKDELERNLYNPNFDEKLRNKKIKNIISKHKDEIGYYNFKQFLAEEHLQLGRQNVNKHGMKLVGDCLINFSSDEIWANPKAFILDGTINPSWDISPLNFYDFKDENSYASKLLKQKVELFAKRYDSIRFDVGWSYINGKVMYNNNDGFRTERLNMGSNVLDMIERTVKTVKGKDFDLKELIYEFEASYEDLPICEGPNNLHPAVKNRAKIFGSGYMDKTWGSYNAFILNRKWSQDELILGVGNHDELNLRSLAELTDIPEHWNINEIKARKEVQIKTLAEIFNVNEDLLRNNPVEFMKYKFAEPFFAKRKQLFFIDFFGLKEQFDAHTCNKKNNYRFMLSENYKSEYFGNLTKGLGFNIMDSLEKTFKKLGLDKSDNELYKKILYYRDELMKPETIKNEEMKEEVTQLIEEAVQETKKTTSHNKHMKPFIIIGTTIIAVTGLCIFAYLKNHKSSSQKLDRTA